MVEDETATFDTGGSENVNVSARHIRLDPEHAIDLERVKRGKLMTESRTLLFVHAWFLARTRRHGTGANFTIGRSRRGDEET